MWPLMMVESPTWQETGERMEMYITFSPSDGMYVLFQEQVTFNGQLTTVQLVLCVNEPSLRSGMSLMFIDGVSDLPLVAQLFSIGAPDVSDTITTKSYIRRLQYCGTQ
jgi:hypothetical protein